MTATTAEHSDAASGQSTLRAALAAAPRRHLLAAGGLLAASLLGYAALAVAMHFQLADMMVYRAEGAAAAAGHGLYNLRATVWKLPATYPPFAALLFVPASWVPMDTLRLLVTEINVVLLGVFAHLSFTLAQWPRRMSHRPAAILAAVALGLWAEPVFQTFTYGQINLVIACLALWDLTRPDSARGKGVAIGIAAGIKLTPALFAVYLLLTGRVRAAATAAAAFAGTVLIGWLVLPRATAEYWTRLIFDTRRVGKVWIVDDQSLQGLVARLAHTTAPGLWWAVPAAATAAAGLAAAWYATRKGLESWGILAAAVTALLISPISWTHHWVWCVPLITVLAAEARGAAWRRAALAAVAVGFTVRTMWFVHRPGAVALHLSWWRQPLASPYPLMGLVFLAVVALRAYTSSPARTSSASMIR